MINDKLELPPNLPSDLENLLKRLLEKDPDFRLGCIGGFKEIKEHQWFNGIDWKKVYNREYSMTSPDENKIELF